MFDVKYGWLHYRPTATFILPTLTVVEDENCEPVPAPLMRNGHRIEGGPSQTLYRLTWPGELPEGHEPKAGHWDSIPATFLERLGLCSCGRGTDSDGDGNCFQCAGNEQKQGSTHHDLLAAMCAGWRPPERLPLPIAYHMAVNARRYYPDRGKKLLGGNIRHPVGGLPAHRVEQVLSARFALDGHAVETLNHLRWQAQSWDTNPHVRGFDTMARDILRSVCHTLVQMFFWLLGDHCYDLDTQYWVKTDDKYHWWQMAGYLFWVDRTGQPEKHARMLRTPLLSEERFPERCPDIMKGLAEWRDLRGPLEHVTGERPGIQLAGDDHSEGVIEGNTIKDKPSG